MTPPLVYVVILNYNGERWLEACLCSLACTDYPNYKVLLVDNASTDDSVELISRSFAQVEVIANNSNCGFSEGNNVGIRAALASEAEYIVLLNPDTKVTPEWLQEIVTVGEAESALGILGAVQLSYDGADFGSWTKSALPHYLAELNQPEKARRWLPVEWVEGACFAVKRKVFVEIGLLDPVYFAFYEELDFCRRASSRGYQTALVTRSRIHHYRGGVWESEAVIKQRRNYLADYGQFIYAITDPRRSFAQNFLWYWVTLGTKLKEAVSSNSLLHITNVLRMQFSLLAKAGVLWRKWRRDRAALRPELLQ